MMDGYVQIQIARITLIGQNTVIAVKIGRAGMNDRYLFRAKRTDNGEWVEGLLTIMWGQLHIISPDDENTAYPIDESTICQCAGLKKFYEKDIVKRTDIHLVGAPSIGIIEYDIENTAFAIHWIDEQLYSPMYPWKERIEVCGNIFDNPELLEEW